MVASAFVRGEILVRWKGQNSQRKSFPRSSRAFLKNGNPCILRLRIILRRTPPYSRAIKKVSSTGLKRRIFKKALELVTLA